MTLFVPLSLRPEQPWRDDAAELRDADFPLALYFNYVAEVYERDGKTLRSVPDILERWAICEANECQQYDGRKCKLCHGCSGRGDRQYLHELAVVGGKCLLKEPLWT